MVSGLSVGLNIIKILMLVFPFYPIYGGGGNQAKTLSEELLRGGICTSILTSDFGHLPSYERVADLSIYRVPFRGRWPLSALTYILGSMLFLIRNKRIFNVLHVHGFYWLHYASIFVSKLLGKRVLIKMSLEGDDDPLTLRKKLFGWIHSRFFLLADNYVSVSKGMTDSYLNAGLPRDKLWQIPNGVDTEGFSPVDGEKKSVLKQKMGFGRHRKIVSFAGLISERKGSDILIDVWQRVTEEEPHATLVLMGETESLSEDLQDEYIESLESKIQSQGLADKIVFTGSVDNVCDYLRISDIFVFPSLREGLPNALLEAMATGLASVAFKIPGVTDLIQDGIDGFLIQKGRIDAFADAVLLLLRDENYRKQMGAEARKKTERIYRMENIVKGYVNLYETMLSIS